MFNQTHKISFYLDNKGSMMQLKTNQTFDDKMYLLTNSVTFYIIRGNKSNKSFLFLKDNFFLTVKYFILLLNLINHFKMFQQSLCSHFFISIYPQLNPSVQDLYSFKTQKPISFKSSKNAVHVVIVLDKLLLPLIVLQFSTIWELSIFNGQIWTKKYCGK